MKKIIFFFLAIFFFMTLTKAEAVEPFVKSVNNPLPMMGTYLNWDEQISFQPSVIFENGIYKMWYASIGSSDIKIGYATSSDGLSWQKQTLFNPNPNFPEHDPFVFKKDGVKTLYFASSNNGTKIFKINQVNDIEYDQSTLQEVISPSFTWEGVDNTSPSVIFDNGIYYLFYSAHNSIWRIGLATSTDGQTWTKCPLPILNLNGRDEPSDGPEIFKKEGRFFLFFHLADSTGIKVAETTSLSCSSSWSNPEYILKNDQSYDINYLTSPSVFEKDGQTLLYYGGKGVDNIWNINLATSGTIVIPTQIPTPLPTQTPTPTPLPNKTPLVIVPGIFTSWNKNAIVYNQPVANNDWITNPTVYEYDGLITTLENLGYKRNVDYYFFNYDWRQSLDNISDSLKIFLNQKVFPDHPDEKVNLIGHSLGGLISRIYQQKNLTSAINKIVTVGSPHLGAAQVYKVAEAGEIDKTNNFLWLAEKIVLQLYRDGLKTDKQIIEEKLPIVKDLLPTFNYLKDKNNQIIPVENMLIKNYFLLDFNNRSYDKSSLFTIAGQKGNTDSGYKIKARTLSDQILNLYPDGRPIELFSDIGDYTVLLKSAVFGDNRQILNFGHGELIYKKDGIEKILNQLEINIEESKIVEGRGTNIDSSLIFLLFSPIKLSVEHNDQTYIDNEGMLFIENADSGIYTIKAQGIDKGQYSILIGQIGSKNDVWTKIDGKINNNIPDQQIDQYIIEFDQDNPKEIFYSQNHSNYYFEELITYLKTISDQIKSKSLDKAIKFLEKAKQNYLKKQLNQLKTNLLVTNKEIINLYNKNIDSNNKISLISAINKLEILYGATILNSQINEKHIKFELWLAKNSFNLWERFFLLKKKKDNNINIYQQNYLLIKNKLALAEKGLNSGQLALAEICLINIKKLLSVLWH